MNEPFSNRDWTEPRPFPSEAPAPPFPLEALPPWAAAWVRAQAEAKQVAPEVFGVLFLAVLSTCAMRRVRVSPRPDWNEPVNLYLVVVLPVGEGKSPAFASAFEPIWSYEAERRRDEAPELRRLDEQRRLAELRVERLRAKLAAGRATPNENDRDAYEVAVRERDGLPPQRAPFTLTADDATPEALSDLLAKCGERLAVVSPEGGPFEILRGRYSDKEPNVELFLKCHRGEAHRVNRVGRGATDLAYPLLTLAVTVQPLHLAQILANDVFAGRGVLARCWIVRGESRVGYRDHAREPNPNLATVDADYASRIRELLDESTRSSNRTDEERGVEIRLAPDALAAWNAWKKAFEPRLRPDGDLGPITNWANKVFGGTLRVAGLLHFAAVRGRLADVGAKPINATTMKNALRLLDYFTAHALRIFDEAGDVERFDDARTAWRWLRKRRASRVTTRELQNANGRRFKSAARAESALSTLEEHGYLRKPDPLVSTFEVHPISRAVEAKEPSDKSDALSPVSDVSDAEPDPNDGPPYADGPASDVSDSPIAIAGDGRAGFRSAAEGDE